jgi:hypothetical protein
MRIGIPLAVLAFFAAGCEKPKTYTTTVEVIDIEHFGDSPDKPNQVNFAMRFAECPGENHRFFRGDKQLAECTKDVKEGDKVKIEILSKWASDRGAYRTEITKMANCPVKQDPKEEANYEMTSLCTDIKTTGVVVGVHCDRSRPKELTDKCPFLRRN